MSDYTKKKLGLIFLSIGAALVFVAIYTFYTSSKDEVVKSFYDFAIVALIVGAALTIVSIVLLVTIPRKGQIYANGKKSYCIILRAEASHSRTKYGVRTSYYFLVEYETETGNLQRDGVPCRKEEIDSYKPGTKLLCYIKDRSVYVPRPFKVIEENIE